MEWGQKPQTLPEQHLSPSFILEVGLRTANLSQQLITDARWRVTGVEKHEHVPEDSRKHEEDVQHGTPTAPTKSDPALDTNSKNASGAGNPFQFFDLAPFEDFNELTGQYNIGRYNQSSPEQSVHGRSGMAIKHSTEPSESLELFLFFSDHRRGENGT
jgi:hypothetical protein